MIRDAWKEHQLNAHTQQPASTDDLIDSIKTLSGAHARTFDLVQDVNLAGLFYRLSAKDFDLKGKQIDTSLTPTAPATLPDLDVIDSIFEHLLRDQNDTKQLSPQQVQLIVNLRLYACFAHPSPLHASYEALRVLHKLIRFKLSWSMHPTTLQVLVNFAKMGFDRRLGALLVVLVRKQTAASPLLPQNDTLARAIADLSIVQLRSLVQLDRRRARRLFLQCFADPTANTILQELPPVMVAALLEALVRSEEGAAEDPHVRRLASILDRHVMSTPSNPLDLNLQYCIVALAAERALAQVTSLLHNSSLKPLNRWLMTLAANGHLDNPETSEAVHAVLLRSQSRRFDELDTEPEVKRFLFNTFDQYSDVKAGTSSWAWAVRVLLGMSSSLIRPSYKGRRRDYWAPDFSVNLLQVHEADALLEAYLQQPEFSPPTPFLCLPLMQNLLAQFPPRIDRCMVIYRSMTRGSTRPRWLTNGLEFLSHLRDSNDGRTADQDRLGDGQESPREGPDQQTMTLLLEYCFLCDPPDVAHIKEIMQDAVTSHPQRLHVLSPRQRVRYMAFLLPLLETEEAAEVWESLCEGERGRRTKTDLWSHDWNSDLWHALIEHLSGLDSRFTKPNASLLLSHLMDKRPFGWVTDSDKVLRNPLRVPLPLLLKILSSAVQEGQIQETKYLWTTLLHKLAMMATQANTAVSRGQYQWTSHESTSGIYEAVRLLHDFILEDRTSQPDVALSNALMNAYNRCKSPGTVYDIWEALAVATLRTHGSLLRSELDHNDSSSSSSSSSASASSPHDGGGGAQPNSRLRRGQTDKESSRAVTMDGVTVAILLDTAGRFGPGVRGKRAWNFITRLDADLIASIEQRLESNPTHPETMTPAERRKKAYLLARPHLIRNMSAWNSWLEFLCRQGHLNVALEQLDIMKNVEASYGVVDPQDGSAGASSSANAERERVGGGGGAIKPSAKTLGTMLRFAARERDRARKKAEAAANKDEDQEHGAQAQQKAVVAVDQSEWAILRKRVQDGEFGPDIWAKVKDAGTTFL